MLFRKITGIVLTILMVFLLTLAASAAGLSDLTGEAVTEEGKLEQYGERLAFSAADGTEAISDRIVSFDVNDDGQILLALENNQLAVLDQSGKLLYRFTFSVSGSYYAQWKGEHILLFGVRSDLLFELTLEGKLVSATSIKQSTENTFILDEVEQQKEIRRNGVTYRVSKDKGLFGFFQGYTYDRLYRVSENGTEEEIAAVSEGALHRLTPTILPIIFVICVPLIIVIGGVIIPKVRSKKRKTQQTGN